MLCKFSELELDLLRSYLDANLQLSLQSFDLTLQQVLITACLWEEEEMCECVSEIEREPLNQEFSVSVHTASCVTTAILSIAILVLERNTDIVMSYKWKNV